MFGSYGRGEAGVGSDLDLLIVDEAANGYGSQSERRLQWPLKHLPLCCDALVLRGEELQRLLGSDQRMGQELQRDLRWLWTRSGG